jgi:Flp pilus assembly protein TadD
MPRVATADIAHNEGTDHRIPRRKGEYETSLTAMNNLLTSLGTAPQAHEEKLVPVPGTMASSRDLAVGTFELISLGDLGAAATAAPLLKRAQQENPTDPELLSDLAWLANRNDDRKRASELYAEALRQDPVNIPANTNYGVLLAQAGQLQDAARLWNAVFRMNPSISELGYNLGMVECALGNRPAAERILERLLAFSPDDRRARQLLDDIAAGRKSCGAAK